MFLFDFIGRAVSTTVMIWAEEGDWPEEKFEEDLIQDQAPAEESWWQSWHDGTVEADMVWPAVEVERPGQHAALFGRDVCSSTPSTTSHCDVTMSSLSNPGSQCDSPRSIVSFQARRRLRRKRQDPSYQAEQAVTTPPAARPEEDAQARRMARDLARRSFAQELIKQQDPRAVRLAHETKDQHHSRLRGYFQDLPWETREWWIQKSIAQGTQTPVSEDGQDGENAEEARDEDNPEDNRGKGFLLTYNGSWGLSEPALEEAVRASGGDIDQLVKRMKKIEYYERLFNDFWQCMHRAALQKRWTLSASMEVSTKSEQVGRIHMHVFISAAKRFRLTADSPEVAFRGQKPSHLQKCNADIPRFGACRIQQGHCYLQICKVGMLHWKTMYPMGEEFTPKTEWIMSWWRLRKMSFDDAIRQLLELRVRGVQHAVAEIRFVQKEHYMLKQKEKLMKIRCQKPPKPFKQPRAEEIAWWSQYKDESRRRFKFLIYDGPSRTGKTARAENWCGPKYTLTMDCQGQTSPGSLQGFLTGQYLICVFDEANWQLCFQNKVLFQAGDRMCAVNKSAANANMFELSLTGVPLICCSNDFWEGYNEEEHKCAGDWIKANSYYIHWDEPTWEDAM